ncbi:MAG: protein kinase [Armatimonadetes bacterium]|nr:protein kinase [Armatimonadota bacterium]
MQIDGQAALETLLADGPLALAVQGEDGQLTLVSTAFERSTGLRSGSSPPESFARGCCDGQHLQIGEQHFEVWGCSLGSSRLLLLRNRSEMVRLEDEIWELQTRLSTVYSELSVKNQTLSSTLEELRRRDTEMTALNGELEMKVQEQLRQLERSNKLRRYLSPEVANSIVSSDAGDLPTRKRLLTVFFADIAAFDELVSDMESEEIIEILSEYNHDMTSILFAHGGTLDKFISARIIAFFGDPLPQEDHAVRAVRTALHMRDRLRARRASWFPAGEVDLQVGIHSGYATVGNVGSEYRMDYTVIGKNVTLASSLQQEARPGQVLLSARTCELVKDAFDLEGLQVSLRGSSRPVTVYNARAEKTRKQSAVMTLDSTDSFAREAAPLELVGKTLGHYLVTDKLGEGGMGVVYKAQDERLGRTVALKVLPPELAADTRFVARFRREARALASLNSPYIAQIYDIGEDSPPFFVMELIEGPTLSRLLQDLGRLPLGRSLDLVNQMAHGLAVAAERGVIHRDIKPDNVMLTLKGQVKLTDFGLAKAVTGDPNVTSRGIVLGTPLYMSPEQTRGEELDLRADIYSLGATFFQMLVGEPPFRGQSAIQVMRQHEEASLPPLSGLPGSISSCAYGIVTRMMAKKREDRFQTYESLIEALEAC